MNRSRILAAAALVLAFVLVSCTKQAQTGGSGCSQVDAALVSGSPVSFTFAPAVKAKLPASDADSLKTYGFYVSCYNSTRAAVYFSGVKAQEDASLGSGVYSVKNGGDYYYWPRFNGGVAASQALDFVASYPYPASCSALGVFGLEVDARDANFDMLMAKAPARTLDEDGSGVSLSFNHMLACLYEVKVSLSDSVQSTSLRLKSITLGDVVYKASMTPDMSSSTASDVWTPASSFKKDYALALVDGTCDKPLTSTTPISVLNDSYYFIPQTLSATLVFALKANGADREDLTLKTTIPLEMGVKSTVKVKVNPVFYSCSVTVSSVAMKQWTSTGDRNVSFADERSE